MQTGHPRLGPHVGGGNIKKWRIQQEAHWKTYKSQKSSKCWTIELLKQLMNTVWDMWHNWNQALHEEPNNRALILEHEINNKVTTMYQLGPGDSLQLCVRKVLRKMHPRVVLSTSSSTEPCDTNNKQPGGTAVIVTGSHTSRILSQGQPRPNWHGKMVIH